MDIYQKAFTLGSYKAEEVHFQKEARAEDLAHLIRLLGAGAVDTAKGVGTLLKKTTGGAQLAGKGAKYLGTVADPRKAMMLGGGTAALATILPAVLAKDHTALAALKAAAPGLLATTGAGLAMGANPGLLGGSPLNRMSHELSMVSSTPAGGLGVMASLVGLPAALIAYGKMKGKEEASLF